MLPIKLDAVVLECRDVVQLADFYARLLGWDNHYQQDDGWADIVAPSGGVKIAFQKNEEYIPPIWPEEPGMQQMMVHLDFTVQSKQELETATEHALSCGAVLTKAQYGDGKWVTFLDPAGHPFCFVLWE